MKITTVSLGLSSTTEAGRVICFGVSNTSVVAGFAVARLLTPEQLGSAQLTEFLQPPAHLVQQLVLESLGCQILQLGIDDAQLAHEPIQPLARLLELYTEYFFIFRSYFVHEIT